MSNCEDTAKIYIASFFHYLTQDHDDYLNKLAKILSVTEAQTFHKLSQNREEIFILSLLDPGF
jgi:hypothetical protein